MSTVRVSIDFPPTPQAPWATPRVLRSVLDVGGWGSATSELDAARVATDVATSAVEDAAAEHALVCELARPQRQFRLSVADGAGVRRIVGDRNYRYPRRPRHAPP